MNKEFLRQIHEKNKEDWIWKHDGWIKVPEITLHQKELSNSILSREDFVRKNFGDEFFKELMTESVANEIKKSWDIENIQLNTYAIRSLLVNSLNLDIPEWKIDNKSRFIREESAVQATLTMLNDRNKFDINKLCEIHALLKNPSEDINWGKIRKIDIHIRKEVFGIEPEVVYIGPPADKVPELLDNFFDWWDKSREILPKPVGAALAHLYLVAIHPFENGNGRIARMVTDKYMIDVNDVNSTYRPYSISHEISRNKDKSNETLGDFSKNGNINQYLDYILDCHNLAVKKAEKRAFFLKDMKKKFGNAWSVFTREERDILRFSSCSFDTNIFGDIKKYKSDFPNSSKAFNGLVSRNIILNDKINYELIYKINKNLSEKEQQNTLFLTQANKIFSENMGVIKNFNDLCDNSNTINSLCIDTDDGRLIIDTNSNIDDKREKNIKFICENTMKYSDKEYLNLISNVLSELNKINIENKNEKQKN